MFDETSDCFTLLDPSVENNLPPVGPIPAPASGSVVGFALVAGPSPQLSRSLEVAEGGNIWPMSQVLVIKMHHLGHFFTDNFVIETIIWETLGENWTEHRETHGKIHEELGRRGHGL